MTENPRPEDGDTNQPQGSDGRRYWIDADGNVHGVVMTIEVDHFVEFTDQAIDLTTRPRDPDKPTP